MHRRNTIVEGTSPMVSPSFREKCWKWIGLEDMVDGEMKIRLDRQSHRTRWMDGSRRRGRRLWSVVSVVSDYDDARREGMDRLDRGDSARCSRTCRAFMDEVMIAGDTGAICTGVSRHGLFSIAK